MVEVLEEIILHTKNRIERVSNVFNEIKNDCTYENQYTFESGKIYGIIGEHDEGGELISSLLSGKIPIEEEKVLLNGNPIGTKYFQENGWYVGKKEYSKGLIKKEISVRKALTLAIKNYGRYSNINDIINEFGLNENRLDYKVSMYSGERWRVSIAIGYASRKKIFCFSWMDTAQFNHVMLNSHVFRLFSKVKQDSIIILPTSREQNVYDIADVIINIDNPEYNYTISTHPIYKNLL